MKRNFPVFALGAILSIANVPAQSLPESHLLTDAEIRKILIERIDTARQSVGIVVGVIEPKGRRVVAYGVLDKDDKRPLDGDTVFEIGSVTKVFTSLALADMVQRGEVALAGPIAGYLPADVKVPQRGGHAITLQDLSTQTSGLPRLPANVSPQDPANPYADYSAEKLYRFLSTYELTRDIGSQYEYSNLGAGLLGHALARRAGTGYEALVTSRICRPLEMTSTRIALTPEMKARFAVGHNDQLKPVANWDFQALAGCGALRSSANDLPAFLAANPGYTKSPLAPAMAAMLKVRRPVRRASRSRSAGTSSRARATKSSGTTAGRTGTGLSSAMTRKLAPASWCYRTRSPRPASTISACTCPMFFLPTTSKRCSLIE